MIKTKIIALWMFIIASTQAIIAANVLTVNGASGMPGTTVTVSIDLASDTETEGLQVSLTLPEGTVYETASVKATGRASMMTPSGGVKDGLLNLTLYSVDRKVIAAGSGEVMTFNLKLGPTPGLVDMHPEVVLASRSGERVPVECQQSILTINGAAIELQENRYALGRVALGEKQQLSVRVKNPGTEPLLITGLAGAPQGWSLEQSVTVAPQESGMVMLNYIPGVRGETDAVFKFDGNVSGENPSLVVSSTGYGRNEIALASDRAKGGEVTTISVNLKNYDPIAGFTLKVELPRGFNYVNGSFSIATSRGNGHGVTATTKTEKNGTTELTLTAYSLNNTPFINNDGMVATFGVYVASRNGTYIRIKEAVLPTVIDGNVMNVVSETNDTYLQVSSPTLSVSRNQDLGRTPITSQEAGSMTLRNYGNEDLTITAIETGDDNLVVNDRLPIIVGPWQSRTLSFSRTDDARGVINDCLIIHSNDPETPVLSVDVEMERYAPNEITLVYDEKPASGSTVTIDIQLDNYDVVEGIQFDLKYDPRLDGEMSVTPAGRAAEFKCNVTQLEAGVARILCYGMGSVINPGSGKVLEITITPNNANTDVSHTFGAENVILGNSSMDNLYSGAGVDDAVTDLPTTVTVYNMHGILLMHDAPRERLRELPPGLYIINGAKIKL